MEVYIHGPKCRDVLKIVPTFQKNKENSWKVLFVQI